MQLIDNIGLIADRFDAIVLDQWGVLHDGRTPYPSALSVVDQLTNVKLGVLSNSGKRAAPNAERIADMGFDVGRFDAIMTSGEALWRHFAAGPDNIQSFYPIEGRGGDAAMWAEGLSLTLVNTVAKADAIVLMGLPDGSAPDEYDTTLRAGLESGLPLYCSNPDLTSPRGGDTYVMSPGVLAERYRQMGGTVHLFGKPHLPIFSAMQTALATHAERILMVGDSLHHDIAGAHNAGWASLLIRAGIHAPSISDNDTAGDIALLSAQNNIPPPTFSLPDLR